MKIVPFFSTVFVTVLISFVIFFFITHEKRIGSPCVHVYLLPRNEDGFRLNINGKEFNVDEGEERFTGSYSYMGAAPKRNDSAHIQFKAHQIDTTFAVSVSNIDTIAIGVRNDGNFFFKKI